jgi:glutamyl-tRNA synthetase
MIPITRIAPSPTGHLHVGTARVALYNFLFARKYGGKFLLRIEDTDIKRSSSQLTESIIESLKWLGLETDNGVCKQSDRFPIYQKYADLLIKNKTCYFCYCTPQEIEERRKIAISQKKARKYDRKCLNLSPVEREKLKDRAKVIRFFVPEGMVRFDDELHGKLERDSKEIEDFVILKSDGTPSYNFACVIDDHEFGITHVIRGEDHIPNTFKQILLYRALGWECPKFIHLPMILGPDRSKLSKRHGAISILEYRDQGILPEALINFLALLGWSAGDDREFYSLSELIEAFSIDRLSHTPSIFDARKLEWMNWNYINKLSDRELLDKILNLYKHLSSKFQVTYLLKVVSVLKPRIRKLADFMEMGDYFFCDPEEYDKEWVDKYFRPKETYDRLLLIKNRFSNLREFSLQAIETTIRDLASELGIKASLLIHPIRLAITGKTGGPSLFHIIEILGKTSVIRRLEKALLFLNNL